MILINKQTFMHLYTRAIVACTLMSYTRNIHAFIYWYGLPFNFRYTKRRRKWPEFEGRQPNYVDIHV